MKIGSASRLFVAILLTSSLATAATADSFVPPKWATAVDLARSSDVDPVVPLVLGSQSIVLEQSSLRTLQRTIGVGQIISAGDASESVSWLCYTVSSKNPKQRIWLTSSEMGGGDTIDGFSAVLIPSSARAAISCPELPAKFSAIDFGHGVRIGMRFKGRTASFAAARKVGSLWAEVFEGKSGEFDVIGVWALEVSEQRVVGIHASHTTSN